MIDSMQFAQFAVAYRPSAAIEEHDPSNARVALTKSLSARIIYMGRQRIRSRDFIIDRVKKCTAIFTHGPTPASNQRELK
jgi:hypothetical protein